MLHRFLFLLSFLIFQLHAFEIQLPELPTQQEHQAAQELQEYLCKMTGTKPEIRKEGKPVSELVFHVGKTRKANRSVSGLKEEEWIIESVDNGVLLSGGGRRGTLYAVYHYLEDICGIRWWNPVDEEVPVIHRKNLPVQGLKKTGSPVFSIRILYALYCQDEGRFASRLRLTADASPISSKYGGISVSGSPNFCHTFGHYVPGERYYDKHPEWFSLLNGKRESSRGSDMHASTQLCLSNQELRRFFLSSLKDYIRLDRRKAAEKDSSPPFIYDISPNDNMKFCECDSCQKIVKREEADSGILLDFVNEIANEIKKDYPEIIISTSAYLNTEKTPKKIVPAENVMIIVADTATNGAQPHSDRNSNFRKTIEAWSGIAKRMRVWDYAVTYQDSAGLPYPSEYTYASDFGLYHRNKISELFIEMEYPVIADARDYKLWLITHYMENPNLDFDALSKDFASRYYGPAGDLFLEYRKLLSSGNPPFISMYPRAADFSHLNLAMIQKIMEIFAKGEKAIAGKEPYLQRWEHARLGIDRTILLRNQQLQEDYFKLYQSIKGYPFDLDQIRKRVEMVWMREAKRRKLPTYILHQEKQQMQKDLTASKAPARFKIPDFFAGISPEKINLFEPETADIIKTTTRIVQDPESETGVACELYFPNQAIQQHPVSKYKFPILWGVYFRERKQYAIAKSLRKQDVKGKGYHWYKLGEAPLGADAVLYFFWSWHIQWNLSKAFDPLQEKKTFEIWAKMKFTGPTFSDSVDSKESDSIFIERVALIKK